MSMDMLKRQLTEVRRRSDEMEYEIIPTALKQAGVREIKLESGHTLSVTEDIRVRIAQENLDAALDWLHVNDHDIAKHEVTVSFQRGEQRKANEVSKEAARVGAKATERRFVHPSTLKAFTKEELAAGRPLPDCFTVEQFNRAKLTD